MDMENQFNHKQFITANKQKNLLSDIRECSVHFRPYIKTRLEAGPMFCTIFAKIPQDTAQGNRIDVVLPCAMSIVPGSHLIQNEFWNFDCIIGLYNQSIEGQLPEFDIHVNLKTKRLDSAYDRQRLNYIVENMVYSEWWHVFKSGSKGIKYKIFIHKILTRQISNVLVEEEVMDGFYCVT